MKITNASVLRHTPRGGRAAGCLGLLYAVLLIGAAFMPLPAQQFSVCAGAADIFRFDGGDIGACEMSASFRGGKTSAFVSAFGIASTYSAAQFSSDIFSCGFCFPINDVRIAGGVFAASFHDIGIYENISFDCAHAAVSSLAVRFPLGARCAFIPFVHAGSLYCSGGNVYGFKAVPEIAPLCLFGIAAELPGVKIALQAGTAFPAVRSEAESEITSSGHQTIFLLACGNEIAFGRRRFLWHAGALYADGRISAQTERKDVAAAACDTVFLLGAGVRFAQDGRRFFFSAGANFLFLPFISASAELSANIRLIFLSVKKSYVRSFESRCEYGLLLPSFGAGIRLCGSGKIYCRKTVYIPLVFSEKTGDISLPSGNSADTALLVFRVLLSGLSVGIKL
ncbi:MAG: hypothetical protein NC041_02565 [Bacteroides sp.]|nr:hypothetical protein [Prevotella sp.]MCM1408502.1 hypothetical protein [Treponema brennaborense]MCM1469337.1 hypothetical protein [Bacteroides sp.]